MEDTYCVLLYSKFSPVSNKIMELVNKCPYDLGKLIKLNTVCLDNEKIRKRINESQQIKIERVPSILVVDEKNGGIEKYEHSKALEWLNEVCIKLENKFNPPPPHPPPPPTQPQQVFVQPLPQKLPEPPTEQVYVSEPLPTPLPQQQEENKPQKNKKPLKKTLTVPRCPRTRWRRTRASRPARP